MRESKIDTGISPQCIRDRSKCKFFRHVDWQMPVSEQNDFPDDPERRRLVDQMASNFGEDPSMWPDVGCGAKFLPEKKGASMVVELQMAGGSCEAFFSERSLQKIDDAIKKHYAKFYEAAQYLTRRGPLGEHPDVPPHDP